LPEGEARRLEVGDEVREHEAGMDATSGIAGSQMVIRAGACSSPDGLGSLRTMLEFSSLAIVRLSVSASKRGDVSGV
jgi:hypothetical protein